MKLHAKPPKPPVAALEPHCCARELGNGSGETDADTDAVDGGGLRYGPDVQ